MPNIPDPNTIPAVLPSDFVREDIPAETDDLQLGQKTPESPERGGNTKPGQLDDTVYDPR